MRKRFIHFFLFPVRLSRCPLFIRESIVFGRFIVFFTPAASILIHFFSRVHNGRVDYIQLVLEHNGLVAGSYIYEIWTLATGETAALRAIHRARCMFGENRLGCTRDDTDETTRTRISCGERMPRVDARLVVFRRHSKVCASILHF